MLAVMILATGITLRSFNILLCNSFDVSRQKEAGLYLIIIGFLLFILSFAIFFEASGEEKE